MGWVVLVTAGQREEWTVGGCGTVIALAFAAIAVGELPIGSPQFLVFIAVASASYAAALICVRRILAPSFRTLLVCALVTAAMRGPMAAMPVGAGSDAFRYLWDARVQRAGLNPYTAIPDDPALASLHTPTTLKMNNMSVPSPYPPFAQLFFRAVTAVDESPGAFKAALVACDLLTAIVLVSWLRRMGTSQLWVLAYAWNPIVVLETALSAHLDVLGALAVLSAVVALAARRRTMAALAFAAGVGIKFLPVVLVPMLWGRVRARDAAVGVALLVASYIPYMSGGAIPLGSVSDVIRRFRFNAPAFTGIERITSAPVASAAAIAVGLFVAAALRRSRMRDDPGAWAWPMAVALMLSPLVYPWYLIWLAPFFFSRSAMPLIVWSVSILPTYVVWELFRGGARWAVPPRILVVEYGAVALGVLWLLRDGRR